MYLKKIIAHGFKSFADNTIIEMDNSIAGIVGPNGSGKSNVVDAVRWVLGEQSVKSLRGDSSMTDIIFAGSKSRNKMNVASVTLIFDNTDHYLNIPSDEISIKRRLYLDGTNEFFLNNDKVRLKDINDILVDSGIAKESFNIISQGKIEEILSSKPTERRIIFEEAASVLKYKKRKEDAIRKLDKTHDNMNRVNDIINELETQIEPLREQKIKANQYLEYANELKELEISLVASDITDINFKYQINKEKISELTQELLQISTNNSKAEAKLEEYKKLISDCDNKINELNKLLLQKTEEVEKLNSQKAIVLERKKYEVDNNKLHSNLIELKETDLKVQNEINAFEFDISTKQTEYHNLIDNINDLVKDVNKLKQEKTTLLNNLNERSRLFNQIQLQMDNIKEVIENNSTLPYPVRSVLNNPKLTGIHNTIGSIIDVQESYVTAILTALGASSTYVVTENEIVAKEAINYLKENKLGRVTFFPLNIIKPKYIDEETLKVLQNTNGYINIASELINYNSKYSNIIKNQLGNVIVADNVDNANIISKKINYRYRVVTLDGEILHVGGSLTGGINKTRNIISEKYEYDKLSNDYNKASEEIKIIETKLNNLDNNIQAFEDKIYLLNKTKQECSDFIEIRKNNIIELTKKLESIQLEIKGTNNILEGKLSEEEEEVINNYYKSVDDKNRLVNALNEINNNKIRLNNELEEFNYSVKKDNSLYNSKNNELKELEIAVNRADVKLDHLLNVLNETYSITYEKAISLYKLEMDSEKARTKVNTLKRNMKALEPVNLTAPEEYDRISTRYEFLIHQQEDLAGAENTLLEIIAEMDKVMENSFLQTFNEINKQFQIVFKELFGGGYAELRLTDSNNILETGIEIIASPPGKSLKSINLLSGGEKTFTAISLLFAILNSRSVPFCILDEVEAALDEVNVDSFGKYITRMKEKTQFIIITHKKKTMEYADILYGITMQESGVSKVVSVKLEDIH